MCLFLSLCWAPQLADAGFLCNKAAVFGAVIKDSGALNKKQTLLSNHVCVCVCVCVCTQNTPSYSVFH